jgi:hypothetical protein
MVNKCGREATDPDYSYFGDMLTNAGITDSDTQLQLVRENWQDVLSTPTLIWARRV